MALAYNLTVVLWGAYVRATGSGAGCGNRWPLCNGVITPHSPAVATIIEFTHRAMSVLDLVVVAILVVWAFRAFPPLSPVRRGAALSAVFLVTEALLGAALVLLDHVARNASANRAYSLSAHLVNTLTLLACLTLTAWLAGGRAAPRARGREAWLAAASLAAFMALGVSGAIAALGDTLFPVRTLAEGFAQDSNPAANVFLRLRLWHPVLAGLVGLWLGLYGVSAWRAAATCNRAPASSWPWWAFNSPPAWSTWSCWPPSGCSCSTCSSATSYGLPWSSSAPPCLPRPPRHSI